MLSCGVGEGLPGFSSPDDKATGPGSTSTSAARFAAAIFNDASKVRFIPLSAKLASRRCSRVKSTCSRATPPGRCPRHLARRQFCRRDLL